MIYTSYFAKLKDIPYGYIPISICGKAPDWYTGLQYKKLAPKWEFFKQWKENHDNDFYIREFNKQVLNGLNPYQVIDDFIHLLPPQMQELNYMTNCPLWANPNINIVLICYEKPDDFCHRHLVANWFEQYNIHVEELIF